jgi:protein O-GlcNAc transferase
MFLDATQLYQSGRVGEAEQVYQRILNVDANHFGSLHHLGLIRAQQNRFDEAVHLLRKSIDQNPGSLDAHVNIAVVFEMLNRAEEAITYCDKAIAISPGCAEAYFTAGNALKALNRSEEAVVRYEKAIALNPRYVEALYNLGNTLLGLQRHLAAVREYDRALAIRPNYAKALNNRGTARQALGEFDKALEDFDRALEISVDDIEALCNRGNALLRLKRYKEALASLDKVLSRDPDNFDALLNCGSALSALKRYQAAAAIYDRVLSIRPDHVEALYGRGNVSIELRSFEEALTSFETALSIKPDHSFALNGSLQVASATCDWPRTAKLSREISLRLREGNFVGLSPFTWLGQSDDPSSHLACAKAFVEKEVTHHPSPICKESIWRNPKIRIAYLSADFHVHPTAYLTAELFELHDRSRFDVLGFSIGEDDRSEMRARIRNAFDQFHEVHGKDDDEVATILNKMQIDIAVDLNGYTRNCRPGILARRPAPIQVNYLVFPSTMGAEFIDYVIGDRIVLPFDQQLFYTEKIVHLPDSYQVNDSKRRMAARTPAKSEEGLPESGFVFCCFNSSYKISEPVFDIWMRLLQRMEGSVLWLLRTNNTAMVNLKKSAALRGVDPARLIFADRAALDAHLARHRLADLFLDTLPYNAHTTASDALWAGLPVVTCSGQSFASRVAASLLHAVGLPELVTNTLQDYEALALRLATEPMVLRGLNQKLQRNRLTCPLFNTDRFRRHMEAAYTRMWEIWQRGDRPQNFSIQPLLSDA